MTGGFALTFMKCMSARHAVYACDPVLTSLSVAVSQGVSQSQGGMAPQRSTYSGTGAKMPRPPLAPLQDEASDESLGGGRSRRSSLATSLASQMSLGGSSGSLQGRGGVETSGGSGVLRSNSFRRGSLVESTEETKLPAIGRKSTLARGP